MKKIILSLVLIMAVVILVGCGKEKQTDFAIDQVSNLAEIMARTSEIAQEYAKGELSLEKFNTLTAQLEAKYEELADIDFDDIDEEIEGLKDSIDDQFDEIEETIQQQRIGLAQRAKDRGLSEPEGMTLNLAESNVSSVDVEGFDSLLLIYNGDYEIAMQEAQKIAEKANIGVNPEFKAAQEALLAMSEEERANLDLGAEDILHGIIYTNHGLLETDYDKLITISVDETGELIIEAVNYEQMNN